jgi:hypothetical protein
MDTNTLLLVGGVGAVIFLLTRPKRVQAATPATAPMIGTTSPTQPGQVPTGNPLAAVLVGLAAGIAGSRMTQSR